MVTPRPGGPVPAFRPPNVETARTPAPTDNWVGCAILAVIALGIGAVSQCSRRTGADNSAAFVDTNVSNGIAAQAPPPVQPLSMPAATRGIAHLRLAVTAEGFPGAMIYSQNCYDALAHHFSWAKLDTCGAFDMLAARSIADADTSALANEAGYFQSEAAAGRYLAAATAAGEAAGEADRRLSQLQARAARGPVAGRRAPAPADNTTDAAGRDNQLNLQFDEDVDPGDDD